MGIHEDDSFLISDEDFKPEIQADYKALHDLFVQSFAARIEHAAPGPAMLFAGFLVRLGIGMLFMHGMKPPTVARNLALWMSETFNDWKRGKTGN